MPIIALEFHAPPEPAHCAPLAFRRRHCSPNVTFSTVSAPVCQKCFIFPMDFHDSYLSLISLILHRCCGAMNPMISRTWRLCVAKSNNVSKRILQILIFTYVRPLQILLPPMVLATLSILHQNAIKVATREAWQNYHGIHFVLPYTQ